MRRVWVSLVAIVATLALAVAMVAGIVGANWQRLGLGGLLLPVTSGRPGPGPDAPGVGGPRQQDDEDWGTIEIYDVLVDGSLSPEATGLAAEVWDTFTRVATPAFVSDLILTFDVGDAPTSDLLAYVYPDDDPAYWHLAANLGAAGDISYLLTTLIHEYMHLLTLGLDQVAPSDEPCETLEVDYGCAFEDAYLTAYFDEFWAGYGADAPGPDNEDTDISDAFYAEHEEDFVTAYSAKNVTEDIAEAFMAYVIEPVPDPSASVVAAKLAFFDRYPELAAIRERIRAEFGDQLQPVWDD